MKYIIVGCGGGVGSLLRFFVSIIYSEHRTSPFPFATLAVNLLGTFLLAYVYGKSEHLNERWVLFLATGLLGSFTTFSTFSLELFELLQEGDLFSSILYVCISIGGGVGCCLFGYRIATRKASSAKGGERL